jgi:hypothetical protein
VFFEVKSFSNKYISLLLIMAFLAVQGCALAAPAAITYGVSKLSTPQSQPAQPAQPAPQTTELRTYPEYVTAMERINMEREKAGLHRRPIMTQEEWVCAQKAGSTPVAPAPAATPAPAVAPAPAPATASTTTTAPATSPAPAPATPPAETPEKASAAK